MRDILRAETTLFFGLAGLRTRTNSPQCPTTRDAQRACDSTSNDGGLIVTAQTHSGGSCRHPGDYIGTPIALQRAQTSPEQYAKTRRDPAAIAKLHRMNRTTQLAAIHTQRDEIGERQTVADVCESFDVGAREVR
jgi:hypothetical protein